MLVVVVVVVVVVMVCCEDIFPLPSNPETFMEMLPPVSWMFTPMEMPPPVAGVPPPVVVVMVVCCTTVSEVLTGTGST